MNDFKNIMKNHGNFFMTLMIALCWMGASNCMEERYPDLPDSEHDLAEFQSSQNPFKECSCNDIKECCCMVAGSMTVSSLFMGCGGALVLGSSYLIKVMHEVACEKYPDNYFYCMFSQEE